MKLILYNSNIIHIGGIETLDYNWCKQASKYYDILLLYKNCNYEQLERLSEYVQFEQYNPEKQYDCDICISMTSWNGYPDSVIASTGRYIQVIHANYKELLKVNYKYIPWYKTTEHLAVSDTVRDIFNELYNENATTMYNILDELQDVKPIIIPKTDNILKLVSATRLSGEKGYNRMIILAKELKKRKIKFIWLIFTDLDVYKINKLEMDEIIYMNPTYNIFPYLLWADYGVQLSDTEGYSYFVNECLQYGTAMLITDFDSAKESVINGYSGYLFNMEMSNLDIDKIVNNIPKEFKYTPKATIQDWIDYLGGAEFKEIKSNPIRNRDVLEIKASNKYKDKLLKRTIIRNEKVIMPRERAKLVCISGYGDVVQ
jgi:glycosyltransferase involved in cell wall biosynthesis